MYSVKESTVEEQFLTRTVFSSSFFFSTADWPPKSQSSSNIFFTGFETLLVPWLRGPPPLLHARRDALRQQVVGAAILPQEPAAVRAAATHLEARLLLQVHEKGFCIPVVHP